MYVYEPLNRDLSGFMKLPRMDFIMENNFKSVPKAREDYARGSLEYACA